jgi:hypothetical protein
MLITLKHVRSLVRSDLAPQLRERFFHVKYQLTERLPTLYQDGRSCINNLASLLDLPPCGRSQER